MSVEIPPSETRSGSTNFRANGINRFVKGKSAMRFKPHFSTTDKIAIASYLFILLGLVVMQWLLKLEFFKFVENLQDISPYAPHITEIIEGAMSVVLILVISRVIKGILVNGIPDKATRFNLNRVVNLIVGIVLFFIVLSMLFANWYAAFVSLGLISLILGFALQNPITSFIAWIYIVMARPYKVGDRIKVADSKGDVIDIGYIETTLWEIKGDELSTEDPTGKIIRFPNAHVLSTPIYNYTWPVFPFVWNEIKFHISYSSDFDYISVLCKKVVEEELGQAFFEEASRYKEILKKLTLDTDQISTAPEVIYRSNENTWIECIVRYPTHPIHASRIKSSLIEKLLFEFNRSKEKVMFPEGAGR
jgi:small-conductance mechanosensitive channel